MTTSQELNICSAVVLHMKPQSDATLPPVVLVVKPSAGSLVLYTERFHRPTFVLLVGPRRFHFSQAVASSRHPPAPLPPAA